ncbi:putative chitinase [Arcicella aurantiaca]|uniref:Putative chitinase n=1 Tax=Arcicella aurantiaca TaxID=591202 RepID=A0A316EER0_9BACT|nr:glycoside hydrolase [Arcicella aurantiaca]PWK27169.1 putative chitinase [Arcicella aurantiaca]
MIFVEELSKIMPNAKPTRLHSFCSMFQHFQSLHQIINKVAIAQMLAQVAHESAELTYTREIASGSAYEGRKDLGNTNVGDGKKYKGRGYIQLTGRDNYIAFTKWLHKYNLYSGFDFEQTPEAVGDDLCLSFLTIIFFWEEKGLYNPEIYYNCAKTTKIINGGYNGLESRSRYFERAKKILS